MLLQYPRPSQVYKLSSMTVEMYFIIGFSWGGAGGTEPGGCDALFC